MNSRLLLFYDLETTGLDEERHEIIELGLRLVGPDSKTILLEEDYRVMPEHPERIVPEAQKVNGFSVEAWQQSPNLKPLEDVLRRFVALSYQAILGGHGIQFDERFLRAALMKFGWKPNWHYQTADTQRMAYPLYMLGKVESPSLKYVTKFFGLEQPEPHRALTDAQLSHEVFLKLLDIFAKGMA